MGHYASEMDSGWAASIARSERILKLRRALKDKSLSSFSVSDIPALYKLVAERGYELSDNEIAKLEQKIKDLTKVRQRC